MDILQLLTERTLISKEESEVVSHYREEHPEDSLESVLKKHTKISSENLRTALAEYYGVPAHPITEKDKIPPDILEYVSKDSAVHYRIIPLLKENGVLLVGAVDPDSLDVVDVLSFISSRAKIPYKIALILEEDFEHGIKHYENLTGEVNKALGALETELSEELTKQRERGTDEKEAEKEAIREDAPVTKIVATILRYAVDGRASDIHLEPTREKVMVRFRVDGLLSRSLELPIRVHLALTARVKILASIRLDEKRKPQDGRFSATIDGRRIDFRVSTLPTYFGEKVVMRILDPEKGVRTLADTGVSPRCITAIRQAIQRPYGIILVSGPTGSGKSTTLYSILSELDRAGKNVVSLEDPIEYNIEGVSQSQIRPEINYTFGSGLRSILRQDPDIIMVGEIRDAETAQLAIQAALTGHLVLSTIHTNNAIGVISRLVDMGVDRFLIAPTLILTVAQRLVRRMCPGAGEEIEVTGVVKDMIDKQFADLPEAYRSEIPKETSVLRTKPSPDCPTGTRGRMAVMEALNITPEIQDLILKGSSEAEYYRAGRTQGFLTMKEDAIIKSLKHEIPFEEVADVGGSDLVDTFEEEEVVPPHESSVDNVSTVAREVQL